MQSCWNWSRRAYSLALSMYRAEDASCLPPFFAAQVADHSCFPLMLFLDRSWRLNRTLSSGHGPYRKLCVPLLSDAGRAFFQVQSPGPIGLEQAGGR
jgi:hypothetical protein